MGLCRRTLVVEKTIDVMQSTAVKTAVKQYEAKIKACTDFLASNDPDAAVENSASYIFGENGQKIDADWKEKRADAMDAVAELEIKFYAAYNMSALDDWKFILEEERTNKAAAGESAKKKGGRALCCL